MTYTAEIAFRPAYWNRTCQANIPARWTAYLQDDVKGRTIYADGCQTREEAISDLIAKLREAGLSGKLKLVNI